MIIPGSLVACRYQEMYYGIVVQFNSITSEEIRRDLARQYRKLVPHFAIHFLENDEYDCISLDDISAITEKDVHQHDASKHFQHYKKLILDGRLILKNGFYMAADAPDPIFPVACGSPIPYEVITSTRYFTSENYLKQLFDKNDLPFSKEQVMALSCVQNYRQPVFGRYPSTANYKNFAYFGNKLLRDYAGIYLSTHVRLLINDICYIDSEVVRVERITTVESGGHVQFLVSGVNCVGVPFVGIVGQIIVEQTKQKFAFDIRPPIVYKALIEPISSENIVDGEFLPQSDADNRFGNNFTSFSGLCLQKNDTRLSRASAVDLITAKFQFVQNKLLPLTSISHIGESEQYQNDIQEDKENHLKQEKDDIQSQNSLKTPQGAYFTDNSESLQISLKTPGNQKSPEVTQNQGSISFQQCRLLTQISYAFDLAVEMPDQILNTTEIQVAAQYYQKCFKMKPEDQFDDEYDKLFALKGLKCCFCGQSCGKKDLCFIYGLPMLKRPLFQAVFNPPILLGCHSSCAQKTPEIDVLECGECDSNGSESSDNNDTNDESSDNPDQLESDEEPLIQLLLFNKHARNFINKHSSVIYDGLRKALKPERIGLKCTICGRFGAVIGCFNQYCTFTAHYPCVKHLFNEKDGKTFYCEKHRKQ